jgi:hypothetical protein
MDGEPTYVEYTPDLVTYNSNQIKTKEYETIAAKYLILNTDATEKEFAPYSSIIACPETKKVLCFSPPKLIEMDEFKKNNPEINDNILVNEVIEGTMLNLFYDPRIQSWEISSKGAVGGNYWFYRNQYSVGKYKDAEQLTFRQMFLNVLRANEGEDINDLVFLEYLSKEYCYSFILQHPLNHIVKNITSPILYLVSVYHLLEDRIVCIPPTIFEEWNCFLNVRGIIDFPRRFDEESYEEIQERYCLLDSSHHTVGVMFYNLKTGDHAIMENESYKVVRELRGNNPNLQYHYLVLRHTDKVNEFLHIFPKYKSLFYQFYKQYNDYIRQLHQSYIKYYVQKSGERISKKYFPLVYKIHHELFLNATEKRIVRREIVADFIRKLDVKSLIFYLNYTE